MGEEGVFGVEVDPLRAAHAEDVEDPPLQPDEEVEDPDRGRDVEADEVEEPRPWRAEPEAEPGVAEQGQAHGALEAGKLREVGIQPGDAQQQEGDGEAQPHRLVGEEGAAHGAALLPLDHLHRHLHEGVAEPLVVDPLLPQDHHGADHGEAEGQEEAEPQAQGQHPGAPRDRRALGHPLEEVAGHVLAAGDHPLGDVLVVELVPVVLGRGVVGRPEEAGDDELGEAHAGDAAGHHQHDVDGDQLGPGQRQPPVEEADGAAGQNEQEEEEEGRGGAEVQGQVRALDRVRRVGIADVEHQGQDGPDQDAPHRDPPVSLPLPVRRCRHRGPALRRLTRGPREAARPYFHPALLGEAVELFTAACSGAGGTPPENPETAGRECAADGPRAAGPVACVIMGTPSSALRSRINRDRSGSGNALHHRGRRGPQLAWTTCPAPLRSPVTAARSPPALRWQPIVFPGVT